MYIYISFRFFCICYSFSKSFDLQYQMKKIHVKHASKNMCSIRLKRSTLFYGIDTLRYPHCTTKVYFELIKCQV